MSSDKEDIYKTMDYIPISKIAYVLAMLVASNKGSPSARWNWFDAQNYCKSANSTLTIHTSVQGPSYWTGRYQRISHWIKLLGCFEDTDVLKYADENITMENITAGFCQGMCMKSKKTIFAIKNRTCLCLRRRVQRNGRNASECNFTCANHIDSKFTKECGGVNAFNVFKSKKDIDCSKEYFPGDCLAIQCIKPDNTEYFCINCTSSLHGVCQVGNSSNLINNKSYESWENSMKVCKDDHSGYLLGNLPLLNASKACKKINESLSSPSWIGAARQIFQRMDQGNSIDTEEKSNFIKCEKCGGNNRCSFVNCENESNRVVCSNMNFSTVTISPTSTTTGRTSTAQSTKATTNLEEISTTTDTADHLQNGTLNPVEKKTIGPEISAIVVPVIIILLGTILGGIGFICWRQRKTTKGKGPVPEKPGSNLAANQKENERVYHEKSNFSNSSYFILEPKCSYEECKNDTPPTENPYIETKEGEYDHLGNKNSRRKATDLDNYDETTRHSSFHRETEEENYDHLRNSPSRSNIAEDTYWHTSPNQLDSSSDYDVAHHMENKDTENTNDHAGTGMHLQNSNYDYSELKR
ncbi:uncharacterized protein LOC134276892 [Saccostrea cucullata]|uniref:uncharacterized protein LOC134276892 n=1 Tax=Saccostrea cuccullata TaxID=36930 RepID=UPI002ED3F06C